MAANSDRINFKVATVFAALIKQGARDDLAKLQIIPSQSPDKKDPARVEVVCDNAKMELFGATFTGNYWADVRIHLVTHHNDATRLQAEAMYGQIREIIMVLDLVDQVNALNIPDFTLLGNSGELGTTLEDVREGYLVAGDANEDVFAFRCYCCPSTLEGT